MNFVNSRRWSFETTDRQAARQARAEFLEEISSDRRIDAQGAELAFGELVANAAVHASGSADIALERNGRTRSRSMSSRRADAAYGLSSGWRVPSRLK